MKKTWDIYNLLHLSIYCDGWLIVGSTYCFVHYLRLFVFDLRL